MKHGDDQLEAVSAWLGTPLDAVQKASLVRYETWLADEAVAAGGIGPAETDRLFDRHIADSLAFLVGMSLSHRSVVDVGGGVGLPSIPMAIARPDMEFTLVERSRRRADLARRAARILELKNYAIRVCDIADITDTYDVAVFRASLPIHEAAETARHCLNGDGVGLFAVSRMHKWPNIPKPPTGIRFSLSSEGDRVLDSPFWLLRMRRA